jgi:dephospho-CoA kinase
MLRIGITGGIGSGKSFICNIFRTLGIGIYSADTQAKALMNSDNELRDRIRSLFGDEAYAGGQLNRSFLAQKVFTNKDLLNALNELVHPVVLKDFEKWCEQQNSVYILHEAAILFESGLFKRFDKNILITAPEDIRIARVLERDKQAIEKIRERIQNQWPADKLIPLADFIIENDNKQLLLPQILKIDQSLKA